jgi:hypothetical protein
MSALSAGPRVETRLATLTHQVHILEMNGDSYRLKQSKRRARELVAETQPVDPEPNRQTPEGLSSAPHSTAGCIINPARRCIFARR